MCVRERACVCVCVGESVCVRESVCERESVCYVCVRERVCERESVCERGGGGVEERESLAPWDAIGLC